MAKPITIDMNLIENRQEGEEHDFVIIPKKTKDGIQLPAMYIYDPTKKRRKKVEKVRVNIRNMATTKWHPKVAIDTTVPPDEYKAIVDWWFKNAMADEEYSEYIKETFSAFKDKVLKQQTLLLIGWLKKTAAYSTNARTQKYNKRKKDFDAFLINNLTRKLNDKRLVKPGY